MSPHHFRLLTALLVVGLAAGACSDGLVDPDTSGDEDWEPGSGSFVLSGSAEGEKEAHSWFVMRTAVTVSGEADYWEIVLSEQLPYHPMPALFRLVLRGPADPAASAPPLGTHQIQSQPQSQSHGLSGWTASFEDMETHFPWSVYWRVSRASSGGTLTITESTDRTIRGTFRFRMDPVSGNNPDGVLEVADGEFVAHRLP
jgi:hypothetical protein